MKTHPDSIFVSTLEIAMARTGVPGMSVYGEPRANTAEFVPASAYVEMRSVLHKEINALLNRNIAFGTELEAARATIAQLRTAETERPPASGLENETP